MAQLLFRSKATSDNFSFAIDRKAESNGGSQLSWSPCNVSVGIIMFLLQEERVNLVQRGSMSAGLQQVEMPV
jgi:hypothetical protein